jgi:hypothetical protein
MINVYVIAEAYNLTINVSLALSQLTLIRNKKVVCLAFSYMNNVKHVKVPPNVYPAEITIN